MRACWILGEYRMRQIFIMLAISERIHLCSCEMRRRWRKRKKTSVHDRLMIYVSHFEIELSKAPVSRTQRKLYNLFILYTNSAKILLCHLFDVSEVGNYISITSLHCIYRKRCVWFALIQNEFISEMYEFRLNGHLFALNFSQVWIFCQSVRVCVSLSSHLNQFKI